MQDISITISKAKQGDQDALSILYKENYKTVLFAIRSVVRDEDEAMDILQDTFVKAFNSLEQLKDPNKFTAWVKQIAVNNALQNVKKKRPILFSQMQGSEADSDWNVEDSFQEESREGLPDVEIDRKETERLIGEIMDTLPEEQRIVINLFYFEQMSAKEIADEIGVSVTLVNTRLSLGRKRVEKNVLELEKRGTKLYGLAPIPFLLLLFKNVDAQAATIQPDNLLLQSVLKNVSSSQPVPSGVVKEEIPSAAEYFANKASKAVKNAAIKFSAASTTTKAVIIGAVIAAGILGGVISVGKRNTVEPYITAQTTEDDQQSDIYESSTEEESEESIIDDEHFSKAQFSYILNEFIYAIENDDFSNDDLISNGYNGIWFDNPYFGFFYSDESEDIVPLLFIKGDTGDKVTGYHVYYYDPDNHLIEYEMCVSGYQPETRQFLRYIKVTRVYEEYYGYLRELYEISDSVKDGQRIVTYPDGSEETIPETEWNETKSSYGLENLPIEWIPLTRENVEEMFGSYTFTPEEQEFWDFHR